MGNWNLGSVSTQVHSFVEGVPTSLSGTKMLELADRKRDYVETFVGQTIGSNSIAIQYQGPILNLTISETLRSMDLLGVDAQSVKIGDFSISKGAGGNLEITANKFHNVAMQELNNIGRSISYFKVNG